MDIQRWPGDTPVSQLNYHELTKLENWTFTTYVNSDGWYRFLKNNVTHHRAAIHTSPIEITNESSTVYLSSSKKHDTIVAHATSTAPYQYDPITRYTRYCLMRTIVNHIYGVVNIESECDIRHSSCDLLENLVNCGFVLIILFYSVSVYLMK